MTAQRDVDRLIATWLAESALEAPVAYLDETLEAVERTRQRPAWLSLRRWLPMQLTYPRVAIPRAVSWLVVVALLLVAAIVAATVIGSIRRPTPAPFGPAAAGAIVFDRAGDLYVANPDGSGIRPIVGGPDAALGATYSRDGTRIAFWSRPVGSSTATLMIAGADGRDPRPVSGVPELVPDDVFAAVDWSVDSASFVLASGGVLYVVDAGGGTRAVIEGGGINRTFPSWAPTGDVIAFVGRLRSGEPGVYVVRPDGSDERRIAELPSSQAIHSTPAWSPDGDRFVYHADGDIVEVARVGDEWTESTIVGGSSYDSFPVFSTIGNRLAFIRSVESDHGHLFVADADGSGAEQIAPDLVGWAPFCWSPDDQTIRTLYAELNVSFTDVAEPRYLLLTVDGSRPPTSLPADGMNSFGSCSWQRLAD